MACGLGFVRAMGQPPILLFIGPLEEQLDIGIQVPWLPLSART
jgi:hypothetical protein